ncbi:MAG: hypothetical protein M1820_004630 [Bogoriella megaspora]|nr:MAG: hypothetical protein M1820_004630 [Bogoriella megaspora]
MVDPISVTGLALQVAEIVWKIYEYGKQVKDWKNEIRALCEELFALKGVFEHFEQRHKFSLQERSSLYSDYPITESADFREMVYSTREFLDDLLSQLDIPKDRLRRAVKAMAWPLNKVELQSNISRTTRIKQWFVMAMMSDTLDLSKDIHLELRELGNLLRREHEARQSQEQAIARRDMVKWLSPVNPKTLHTKAYSNWQNGTGLWFTKGYFEDWFSSEDSSILWLRGKSGAGKTTLFSSAIQNGLAHTHLNERNVLLYFYCSFDNTASQSLANILASFVSQLSEKDPSILDTYRNRYLSPDRPKPPELEFQILEQSETLDQIYLFVDALNESSTSDNLARSLLRLTKAAPNIRVFVTGTPEADVHEIFSQGKTITVDMGPQRIEDDIKRFVQARINQSLTLRSLTDGIRTEIEAAIVAKADGMFRWVQCQMDFLAAQRTGKAVKKALEQLPDDLNAVYVRILMSILPADRALARSAFIWLSFAVQPMTLRELCEAIVIDESDISIDEDGRLQPPTVLLSICRGLLVHDEDTGNVTLAHSSIRNFLLSTKIRETDASFFGFDEQTAVQLMIRTCLTYLMFDEFSDGCCDREELFDTRWENFPLLQYASYHWAVHASHRSTPSYTITEEDYNLICKFLSTYDSLGGGNFTHWVTNLIPDADDITIQKTEPLYYMASYGLTSVVSRKILRNPTLEIDARGGRAYSTALQVACVRNHVDIVRLLLEHGADPDSRNIDRLSNMYWAETFGLKEVYDLLRQYGARPDHDSEPNFGRWRMLLSIQSLSTYREMENEYRMGPKPELKLPYYTEETISKSDDSTEKKLLPLYEEAEGPFELTG